MVAYVCNHTVWFAHSSTYETYQVNDMMNCGKKAHHEVNNVDYINFKSPQWGVPITDEHGKYYTEQHLNNGKVPTSGEEIQLFLYSCVLNKITRKIKAWEVFAKENLT